MRALIPVVILAVNSILSAAEIDVQSWTLTSLIRADGFSESLDGTSVVQNPFHRLEHAALTVPGGATSTADSEYFADWDSHGNFNFLVNGQHTAGGPPIEFSRSTGSIFFTPQVDSIFSFNLQYNYALGNGIRDAFVSTTLGQLGQPAIYHQADRRLTLLGQFNGQIEYGAGDILLSAGESYAFNYQLQLDSLGGSPTALSTGNGFVDIRITPVPEPTALSLLAFGSLLTLRPSRNRGC